MKKIGMLLMIIGLGIGISVGVSYCLKTSKPTLNLKKVKHEEVEVIDSEEYVNITNLTLDEKIAQMLIVDIPNTVLDENLSSMLTTYKPGGIILFSDNVIDYDNVVNLVNDMQKLSNIPLFIGADEEGGKVQRFTKIANKTYIPAMEKLGMLNDVNLAQDVGIVIGKELRALGVNLDFAPVMDVAIGNSFMKGRSLGSDAQVVSNLGVAIGKGLESQNVIPVYKHFPGHGSTKTDSHVDLPILTETKEELYNINLLPFIEAIKNDAPMIMVGHLATPNITNDYVPASLSKTIIMDLLKEELGYKGIVITDALNMQALTKNYTKSEILEMAINAGVDILLMPGNIDEVIPLIKESIAKGTIKEEQIDNSVRKILTLKKQIRLDNYPQETLGTPENKEIMARIK